jgi:hypothetical protein
MGMRLYINNYSTKLTAQLLAGGTTANVSPGSGAPLSGVNSGGNWYIGTLGKMSGFKRVAYEIVKLTGQSTDALTIARAQEGTSALQFEIGDTLDIDFTAASMTEDRKGSGTNDNAAAGMIGEYLSASAALGAINLATGTAVDVASLALTPGDWEVNAAVHFTCGATTTVSRLIASLGTVSATINTAPGAFGSLSFNALVLGNTTYVTLTIAGYRVSIAGNTTHYLCANSTFGASTLAVGGAMSARRVR